jgi:hypothetical protein
MKLPGMLFLILLLVGCALGGRTIPSAESLSASSGVPADVLQRGRGLWTRECAACHRTYWPDEYPPESWPDLALDMGERTGLGSAEIDDLTKFLVAASEAARRKPETK